MQLKLGGFSYKFICSSECHIHPRSFCVSEPLMCVGSLTLMHAGFPCVGASVLNLVILSHVCLIIRPAKRTLRTEESFFLFHASTRDVFRWLLVCNVAIILFCYKTQRLLVGFFGASVAECFD